MLYFNDFRGQSLIGWTVLALVLLVFMAIKNRKFDSPVFAVPVVTWIVGALIFAILLSDSGVITHKHEAELPSYAISAIDPEVVQALTGTAHGSIFGFEGTLNSVRAYQVQIMQGEFTSDVYYFTESVDPPYRTWKSETATPETARVTRLHRVQSCYADWHKWFLTCDEGKLLEYRLYVPPGSIITGVELSP